ncbi:hypothetical protein H1R20_g14138, partial [Candolleomyces eurysporus]
MEVRDLRKASFGPTFFKSFARKNHGTSDPRFAFDAQLMFDMDEQQLMEIEVRSWTRCARYMSRQSLRLERSMSIREGDEDDSDSEDEDYEQDDHFLEFHLIPGGRYLIGIKSGSIAVCDLDPVDGTPTSGYMRSAQTLCAMEVEDGWQFTHLSRAQCSSHSQNVTFLAGLRKYEDTKAVDSFCFRSYEVGPFPICSSGIRQLREVHVEKYIPWIWLHGRFVIAMIQHGSRQVAMIWDGLRGWSKVWCAPNIGYEQWAIVAGGLMVGFTVSRLCAWDLESVPSDTRSHITIHELEDAQVIEPYLSLEYDDVDNGLGDVGWERLSRVCHF